MGRTERCARQTATARCGNRGRTRLAPVAPARSRLRLAQRHPVQGDGRVDARRLAYPRGEAASAPRGDCAGLSSEGFRAAPRAQRGSRVRALELRELEPAATLDFRSTESESGHDPIGSVLGRKRPRGDQEGRLVTPPRNAGSAASADASLLPRVAWVGGTASSVTAAPTYGGRDEQRRREQRKRGRQPAGEAPGR